MGCICGCHDKLDAIGISGCCFECEKEHDPLRNALLEVTHLEQGQYTAARELLKAEAKKIPLGESDPQRGFSSTFNALMFCEGILWKATEKRVDEPRKSGCYVNGIQVGHEWVKGDIYTKCRLCNAINMDV